MSEPKSKLFSRGEQFVTLFSRGAEFTRELLKENERLRDQLMRVTDRQELAAQDPDDWEKLRQELAERIATLEAECTTVRQRLGEVEGENSEFAQRYVEVEEENNNLANLYVASYQLHSTLDPDEVLEIIKEIVINLIGADRFAIYLFDGASSALTAVAGEGLDVGSLPQVEIGSGPLGSAAARAETTCWDTASPGDPAHPMVCVPLVVGDRSIGAIAIYGLLDQKAEFSTLDHELFNLLGGHAATAIFAAKLCSESERKLHAIQGFIDLLTQ